jgi:hypothetical protein
MKRYLVGFFPTQQPLGGTATSIYGTKKHHSHLLVTEHLNVFVSFVH